MENYFPHFIILLMFCKICFVESFKIIHSDQWLNQVEFWTFTGSLQHISTCFSHCCRFAFVLGRPNLIWIIYLLKQFIADWIKARSLRCRTGTNNQPCMTAFNRMFWLCIKVKEMSNLAMFDYKNSWFVQIQLSKLCYQVTFGQGLFYFFYSWQSCKTSHACSCFSFYLPVMNSNI